MTNKKDRMYNFEMSVIKIMSQYWRPASILVGLAVVVYGGYLANHYFHMQNELKAQEELFDVQKAVDAKIEEVTKANESKSDVKGKKVELATAAQKTPESLVKNFSEQLQKYDSFIQSHKGRNAAAMAAVRKAGLAVEYHDLALAENTLAPVVSQMSKGQLLYGLVASQLATVYMDQKKFSEAIQLLDTITNEKKQAHLHPQSMIRLASCYIETGDYDKAQELLVKVEAEFPQTSAARDARDFQKIIAFKKGRA